MVFLKTRIIYENGRNIQKKLVANYKQKFNNINANIILFY